MCHGHIPNLWLFEPSKLILGVMLLPCFASGYHLFPQVYLEISLETNDLVIVRWVNFRLGLVPYHALYYLYWEFDHYNNVFCHCNILSNIEVTCNLMSFIYFEVYILHMDFVNVYILHKCITLIMLTRLPKHNLLFWLVLILETLGGDSNT